MARKKKAGTPKEAETSEENQIRVVSFSIIDTKTQKPIKGYAKVSKNDNEGSSCEIS